MKRPFIVCHMLTSLDGKVDGAFLGMPETQPALKAYGSLRDFYSCQAEWKSPHSYSNVAGGWSTYEETRLYIWGILLYYSEDWPYMDEIEWTFNIRAIIGGIAITCAIIVLPFIIKKSNLKY